MIYPIQKENQVDIFESLAPVFLSRLTPEETNYFNALFDEFYWDRFEKYDDLSKLKQDCMVLAITRMAKLENFRPKPTNEILMKAREGIFPINF